MVDHPVLQDWLWGAGPVQSHSSGAQVREAELSGTERGQSCVGSGSRLRHWRHSNKEMEQVEGPIPFRTEENKIDSLRFERPRSSILPHRMWTSRATTLLSRGKSLTLYTFRSSGSDANCLSSASSAFFIPARENLGLQLRLVRAEPQQRGTRDRTYKQCNSSVARSGYRA